MQRALKEKTSKKEEIDVPNVTQSTSHVPAEQKNRRMYTVEEKQDNNFLTIQWWQIYREIDNLQQVWTSVSTSGRKMSSITYKGFITFQLNITLMGYEHFGKADTSYIPFLASLGYKNILVMMRLYCALASLLLFVAVSRKTFCEERNRSRYCWFMSKTISG